MAQTMRQRLAGFIDRLPVPQSVIQITIAVLVGLASGVGVWVFKALIELVQGLAFGSLAGSGGAPLRQAWFRRRITFQ